MKPPAIRRRGVALSPSYQAVESAFQDVGITQKHKTKGRSSATTFFVECADDDNGDFVAVATVFWKDTGPEHNVPNRQGVDQHHHCFSRRSRGGELGEREHLR